jgi:hypothetical protein
MIESIMAMVAALVGQQEFLFYEAAAVVAWCA